MKSTILILIVALLLGGCTATAADYNSSQNIPEHPLVQNRKEAFRSLVRYLRANMHRSPNEEIMGTFMHLANQAGMHRVCNTEQKCHLSYGSKKVVITKDNVIITYPNSTEVTLYSPEDVLRAIYN